MTAAGRPNEGVAFLERAVAAARAELEAVERIARALAAHRRGLGDGTGGDR